MILRIPHPYRSLIVALGAACALLGGVLAWGAEPCVQKVRKHERHTASAQKREVFRRAGVPYDRAHRKLYVVDHIVSLELGGTDTIDNMQLQVIPEGKAKDRIENQLAACVCRGRTTLPVAQTAVKQWKKVKAGECPQEAP